MDKDKLLYFWFQQVVEHASVVYELVDEKNEEFKEKSKNNFDLWKEMSYSNDKEFAQMLIYFNELLVEILEELQYNNFFNYYPSLLTHIIMEHNYILGLINDSLTDKDHFAFWNNESIDHTLLIGNSVDPMWGYELTSENIKLAKELYSNPTVENFDNCDSQNRFILGTLENKEIKSICSVDMIEHELREAEMGRKILNELFGGQK